MSAELDRCVPLPPALWSQATDCGCVGPQPRDPHRCYAGGRRSKLEALSRSSPATQRQCQQASGCTDMLIA
eukprot:2412642-Amphidinium_carterae.2